MPDAQDQTPRAPVSSMPREEREPRKDGTCGVDVKERQTSRDRGRRTRKRGKNRRRRPKPDELANQSASKVVDGVICLMTSKIYNVLGSIATEDNAFKPHTIAVDTCSGYNLVRKADLPPDWTRYVIRDAPLPRLAGANSNPLKLSAVVRLAVRLRNTTFRVPFVFADQLAVPVLLGTAFIDAHVRRIDIDARKLDRRQRGSVDIVDGKEEPSPPTRRQGRQTGRADVREEAPQAIRIACWVTIPAMSQTRVRVTTAGKGLVFLEPKPSLQHRHGVRLTNSVAEVLPPQTFEVNVANFSRRTRRLPKHTAVGYAKRNPLAILTTERRVAEGIAHALHLTAFDDEGGEAGAGRPSSAEEAIANAEVRPAECPSTMGGTVRVPNKDPENSPTDWEEEIDLPYIEAEKSREQVLEMLRKHSSLWDGALGTIRAAEHRIPIEPGTKPIRSMPYRKGPAMREMAAKEVHKMLNAGVIEPASTDSASPVVLVLKMDGSLRFCVDYRRLNPKTLADSYPLPRMDDCTDSLGDATVFTTLDCNSGYWQIPVAPEDRDKTTFTTHMGTFRHLRMPLGLKGARPPFSARLTSSSQASVGRSASSIWMMSSSFRVHKRSTQHTLALS